MGLVVVGWVVVVVGGWVVVVVVGGGLVVVVGGGCLVVVVGGRVVVVVGGGVVASRILLSSAYFTVQSWSRSSLGAMNRNPTWTGTWLDLEKTFKVQTPRAI